jgi:hypothetical protein
MAAIPNQGLPAGQVVESTDLVFPLLYGWEGDPATEFQHAGMGFFVGGQLALTASHVVHGVPAGKELVASVMNGIYRMNWWTIPGCDISILNIKCPRPHPYFPVAFTEINLGENVETIGIPASKTTRDERGRLIFALRLLKGYSTEGPRTSISASFPLPKGMSGGPVIIGAPERSTAVGVFVGQNRGELIEDQISYRSEEADGRVKVETERVSHVEYHARGDMLYPHKDWIVPGANVSLERLIDFRQLHMND